jgi:hypothetical protein
MDDPQPAGSSPRRARPPSSQQDPPARIDPGDGGLRHAVRSHVAAGNRGVGRCSWRAYGKGAGLHTTLHPLQHTLHYIFRKLDVFAFQKVLNRWLRMMRPAQVFAELEAIAGKEALAIDGKALCGADDFPGVALVAAFTHQGGQVLDQEPVPDADELQAVRTLLERLPLQNSTVTGDALQTQRDVTQTILEKGGTTFSRSRATNRPSRQRSPPSLAIRRLRSQRSPPATKHMGG